MGQLKNRIKVMVSPLELVHVKKNTCENNLTRTVISPILADSISVPPNSTVDNRRVRIKKCIEHNVACTLSNILTCKHDKKANVFSHNRDK